VSSEPVDDLKGVSIDVAIERLAAWMEVEGRDRADFKVLVTIEPENPWLTFRFVWRVAYDAELPDDYGFAVWRRTGAVHRVGEDGAVEDPELFRVPT
jgi:hypothetical protein